MRPIFLIVLMVVFPSIAMSGGIERRGDPSQILFEDGKNYIEFLALTAHPRVSGEPLPGIPFGGTGNIAGSYQNFSFSYKHTLNDRLTFAAVINEPVAVSIKYSDPAAFFAGSTAEVSSIAYTGIAKYQLDNRFSVYGGVRVIGVDGSITVTSPASIPNPYFLDENKDYQVGYLAGAAYEIPDLALRIAATYESKTVHNFRDNNGAAFQVEMPQAVTLHTRVGITPNTLVFGSIKWREWSRFKVQPPDFFELVPGVGPVNTAIASFDRNIWSYEVGIGHKFSDNWSGSATIGYERDNGDIVGNFSGTDGRISYGLSASYEKHDWKVTAGVSYTDIGDAASSVTSFTDNSAILAGIKIGHKF